MNSGPPQFMRMMRTSSSTTSIWRCFSNDASDVHPVAELGQFARQATKTTWPPVSEPPAGFGCHVSVGRDHGYPLLAAPGPKQITSMNRRKATADITRRPWIHTPVRTM